MKHRLIAVAIFAASFAYFAWLASPQMSWANTATDTGDYIMSTKYNMVSHGPGHPTYTILSRLWLDVFSGLGDVYALALLSATSAALAAALLFVLSGSLVPTLIYMGSMIVVGTATIVDMRAMVILSSLVAYMLHQTGHHALKYAALAGIHIFGVFYALVFVAWDVWRDKRPAWKPVLWFALSLTPYVYIFFANTPSPWLADKSVESYATYFRYSSGMANGLPIWPPDIAIRRETSFALLMMGSLGAALVPLAYGLRDYIRRRDWLLPVLIALPILYYTTGLTPQSYAYLAFGTPFMALAAYDGLKAVPWRQAALVVTAIGAAALIIVNGATMAIGRTLDPDLTAQRFYEALDTLPDDAAIDVEFRGWELQTVMQYTVAHPERKIDNLWEPALLRTREERTTRALREGRLYQTRVLDRVTLATAIDKVGP